MKALVFLWCTVVFSLGTSEAEAQNADIFIDKDKTLTIKQVFRLINKQTDYKFIYRHDLIKMAPDVMLNEGTIKVGELLDKSLSPINFSYEFTEEETIIVKRNPNDPVVVENLQFQVNGTIVDDQGTPLPGANVVEKGTTNGVTADFDGNFSLTVANDNATLVISYIGFATKEIAVNGQSSINVTLLESAAGLDEVVIVGYGRSVKKEDLTGAVSVVGVRDLEKSPLINVDQALQGRASGVQLTQNSGAPGAGLKIRVRGSNSITGSNSPLVVVDGLIDVDINSVNPADIQSISVLKDASASAIYGNRAANGVIIITTKTGVPGKTTIEFGSFLSFSKPSNTIDLLGVGEFIDYANTKNIGATGNPIPVFDTQQKIDAFIANSVNYQDEVYRTAVAQNYQLSFRGGAEKINYYVSGNYFDQEGIAINSDFKRYSLRSNINVDLTDKLSMSTSLNLIRQEGLNNSPGFGAGLALGAVGFDKTTPIYDVNGNYNRQTLVVGGVQESVLTNPIFSALENSQVNSNNRVQANMTLNYNLLKNLDFNISGGIDYANNSYAYFTPANNDAADITAGQNTNNNTKTQYALKLNYNNTFNEKHNLDATAIFEERKNLSKGFNADGRGFFTASTLFDNIGLADTQTIGSNYSERNLRSVIGRATYNYDSRYLVTASIRYDESSVFLKDQGGLFSSFALGWNINNEDFFNSETISTLRLRGGWGQTGNELIGTNDALNLLRNNPWIPNGGATGSTAILPGTRLANPDLTWETTTQTNIGFDIGILNDRFNLSAEYYIKETEDLLLTRQLPRFTGRVDQVINAGEVENKGFDLTLSANIIQNEKFFWDVSANLSSNRNKVLSLIGDETEVFPALTVGGSIPAPAIVRVGEPIGSFYGYVYEGVNSADGNAVYAEERAIIGDPNPDFTYGINNNLSFGGFDLNFFIQGVSGNDVFNRARALIIGRDGRIPFGTSAELRNTWTPSNTSAPLPSLNATNTQSLSSEFVEDGSFIRLKNVSLGYTLDGPAMQAIGAESLRLYVSAQNVFTITDYSGLDPEVNNGGENDRLSGVDIGALPTSMTFTTGLNLKF
ncbi:TonB-dependent receptor [Muricauda sp. CAU 1633]|uniref:SusC/RagA family TonB-linked outer membrane protein n=1 Tax=Allomuricauda sp. CAU 1633 TaxID=2816036 RepID=UPI001A8CD2EC|nr:TonB-dependent receptor [Muricauda sp. CAU 1633]MBO0323635.1 TonB-dependent receptor [Muricauda sp. CAU 1633]